MKKQAFAQLLTSVRQAVAIQKGQCKASRTFSCNTEKIERKIGCVRTLMTRLFWVK